MTLIEEMMLAARGIVALLLGKREAPQYFDLGLRGLVGSVIAFLVATAVNAYLPMLLDMQTEGATPAWEGLLIVSILMTGQIGASAILLRQFGRLDGLVPYLVADNWATFFVTMISIVLNLVGFSNDLFMLGTVLVVIMLEINIARLIVNLRPLQIVGLLAVQLVGVTAALMVIGLIFVDAVPA